MVSGRFSRFDEALTANLDKRREEGSQGFGFEAKEVLQILM